MAATQRLSGVDEELAGPVVATGCIHVASQEPPLPGPALSHPVPSLQVSAAWSSQEFCFVRQFSPTSSPGCSRVLEHRHHFIGPAREAVYCISLRG